MRSFWLYTFWGKKYKNLFYTFAIKVRIKIYIFLCSSKLLFNLLKLEDDPVSLLVKRINLPIYITSSIFNLSANPTNLKFFLFKLYSGLLSFLTDLLSYLSLLLLSLFNFQFNLLNLLMKVLLLRDLN